MSKKNPFGFSFSDDIDIDRHLALLNRLRRPRERVDVVLDTDAFNEVDDQFALAYLIQSGDRLNLKAVYAAPFYNHHSTSPADGMEKSYQEIFRVFELMGLPRDAYPVYRGATEFLTAQPAGEKPPLNPASEDLIRRARGYSKEHPLYVIAIAAATNLATALLAAPEIAEKIFVVWLAGMGFDWHDNRSFNAGGDIRASRVVTDTEMPLVLLPGRGVVDHFHTNGPELRAALGGKNAFCEYMIEKTCEEARLIYGNKVWSRPLSDVAAVGWLADNEFMLDKLVTSPIMTFDQYYARDPRRHLIRYVYAVNRDRLMEDLFLKLSSIGARGNGGRGEEHGGTEKDGTTAGNGEAERAEPETRA